MRSDSKTGTIRVDPVEYFQSRRGLRTAGFEKNRSQIVFGSDGANQEQLPRPKGRNSGPGKEFGRFIELYGFPEKRPTAFSQKRLFSSTRQSNDIDVFDSFQPSEVCVNASPVPSFHAEPHLTHPQQLHKDTYAEEEWQEEESEIYDEEDEMAANDRRRRFPDEALLLEKERLSTLTAKNAAGRSSLISRRGSPPDTKGNAPSAHAEIHAPWQTCAEDHSDGSGTGVTGKITVRAFSRGAIQREPKEEKYTAAVNEKATRRQSTRGRSTWSLASHYEGWQ